MATPARLALYVHIPFCRARCTYCDFNTYAGLEELLPSYVSAVCREIEQAGKQHRYATAGSIYLGGGTPSLLSVDQLDQLLAALRGSFHLAQDAEVTIEANPGTIEIGHLREAAALGINRISLGVQSSHDGELSLLGRIHTWSQAREAIRSVREAGLTNLNLDFIFGLPGQTLGAWEKTLVSALGLAPTHLSLYSLSVEEGTPLSARIGRGELPAPSEDEAALQYELAERTLAGAGYFHYEISNWAARCQESTAAALAGEPWAAEDPTGRAAASARSSAAGARSECFSSYVSRHNLVYWRNGEYLGFGAGATSRLGRQRWTNVLHPADYAQLAEGQPLIQQEEDIDREQEMGETMMLGLRLAEGLSDESFRSRFGTGLGDVFGLELADLASSGLISWDGSSARLTGRGRLLGNQVFARFV
jgi:oxygen-independent coproporphyrinogen-3 oxidase